MRFGLFCSSEQALRVCSSVSASVIYKLTVFLIDSFPKGPICHGRVINDSCPCDHTLHKDIIAS